MVIILIIAIVVMLVIRTWLLYQIDTRDTLIAFTGGLGSGKTFFSVQTAIKALRIERLRWWVNKIVHPKEKKPKPMLYSSIPIRISKREMSCVLTPEILLLQEPIPEHSVVMIDEIGGFCSQFDYQVKNVEYFDDFVRYFRHYIGGKLIVNDQCSENILLQVRRRLNTVYNLMRCRMWGVPFGRKFFASVKVRNISISEEIKTIEEGHTEENHQLAITFVPWHYRYATRCYRVRYEDLGNEYATDTYNEGLNTKRRLRMLKDTLSDTIGLKNVVKMHKREKGIQKVDLCKMNELSQMHEKPLDKLPKE